MGREKGGGTSFPTAIQRQHCKDLWLARCGFALQPDNHKRNKHGNTNSKNTYSCKAQTMDIEILHIKIPTVIINIEMRAIYPDSHFVIAKRPMNRPGTRNESYLCRIYVTM